MKFKFLVLRSVLGYCFLLLIFNVHAQHTSWTKTPSFGLNSEVAVYPKVIWVQGDSVGQFDASKIYVIECWATWCGPCVANIQHLNKLSRRFKNKIVFIGQAVWEEDKKKVIQFVEQMGDSMSYKVAFDGGDSGHFNKYWLQPAKVRGIPQTFVIQNNKVVWMCHPADLCERNLQLLIDKKFSIEIAETMSPLKILIEAETLIKEKQFTEALAKINQAQLDYPDFSYSQSLKIKWLKAMGKNTEALAFAKELYLKDPENNAYYYYDELMSAGEYEKLAGLLDEILSPNPIDFGAMQLRYQIYAKSKDFEGVAKMIRRATEFSNDANILTKIGLIDKYLGKEYVYNSLVEGAILTTGEKALSLDPGHYNLAISVAGRLWVLDKNKALTTLSNAEKFAPSKTEIDLKYKKIIRLILEVANKGIFPGENQIREWEKVEFVTQ